jgi:transcriptional regulator with XRE-family HTH domain
MDKWQNGYLRLVVDNPPPPPNRIRELREAIGMTQVELARRINVTPPALQKVEAGARGLDQQWMRRIAPHLGVTPADLLPLDDNPYALQPDERDLIDSYRSAESDDQEKLRRVADVVLGFKHQPPMQDWAA